MSGFICYHWSGSNKDCDILLCVSDEHRMTSFAISSNLFESNICRMA